MSRSEGRSVGACFGDLLRNYRLAAALSQQELAELAGLSTKTVGNLERGHGRPYPRSVRLLADALELVGPAREDFIAAPRDEDQAQRREDGSGRASPAPEPGSVSSAEPAVRTLPRDTAAFTGRHGELTRLTTAAAAHPVGVVGIQAIGGMAGIGKTALAVHAAHRLAPRFPDGQLFVALHGHTPGYRQVDPADALASLLVLAGVSPARIPSALPGRAALWRDRLAGQRVLLVLDDAVSSDQIEPLLPGAAGSLVLVTSRMHLTGLRDAEVINLEVLPPAEAAALLVHLAGRRGLDPGDAAVTSLCALCGYLPLAIGMVARQLHHHPAWTADVLATDLAAARDRLDLITGENVSVAAGFDLSYAELDHDQQKLFRRLALHPGPDIDRYAAAALAGCPAAAARLRLAGLYDHYLLTEPVAGRYRLHDLLREHARGLADRQDPAVDREQALGRLLDYYSAAAARAEARLARYTRPEPGSAAFRAELPCLPDSATALSWARAERANLLACLDLVTAAGQQARVVTITGGLASLLRQDGPWADGIARHATAVAAASQAGDRRGQAYALGDLAVIRQLMGDFPGAARDLKSALELAREIADRRAQAVAECNLGTLYRLTGDYPAAVEALEAGLSLSRDLGDKRGQANVLSNLGIVRYLTGDYPGAVRAQAVALEVARELGDRLGQVVALLGMGHAQLPTGDWEQAGEKLAAALELARGMGNQLLQANALSLLGSARIGAGDHREAAGPLAEALSIFRDLGNRLGQANALTNVSRMQRLDGEHEEAARNIDQAVHIYRDIGDPDGESEAVNEQGTLHLVCGDVHQARKCHQRARELARAINASWDEACALAGLGRCARAAGRQPEARDLLRQAYEIFRRIGAVEEAEVAADLRALDQSRSQP